MVKEYYSDVPTFQFFQTPIVLENIAGDITKEWDLFVKKQFIIVLKALSAQKLKFFFI